MNKLCATLVLLLSIAAQAGDTYPSIFYAAYNNDVGVAAKYIESGSSIELSDNKNRTPLMAAAEIVNTKMVIYLLENGANQEVSRNGATAFDLAQSQEVRSAIETFNKARQNRPAGWTR
jgi:ankyrin repeat protein